MLINSEQIIETARSWIGTKFHHQGRIKNASLKTKYQTEYKNILGGVDCLGLIIGIAKELNLKNKNGIMIHSLDYTNYPINIENNDLYKKMSENLYEINHKIAVPADIICFKIQKYVKHVAIYSYKNKIIHVTQETNYVIEHSFSEYWKNKIFAAFRFTELYK